MSSTGVNIAGNSTVGGNMITKYKTVIHQEVRTDDEIVTTMSMSHIDSPSTHFTGRTELLQKIHSMLHFCSTQTAWEHRIVVLSGLNGIGKSELARQYVSVYMKDPIIGENVAWLEAGQSSSLISSFKSLAQQTLNLPIEKKSEKDVVRSVYHHFFNHIKTGLFIFDSASSSLKDPDCGIYNFLPTQQSLKTNKPLILITSTNNDWAELPPGNVLPIPGLSKSESVEYLRKRFGLNGLLRMNEEDEGDDEEMKAVYELEKTIQGHPNTLKVAASSISNKSLRDLPSKILNYITQLKPDEPLGGSGPGRFFMGKLTAFGGSPKNMQCVTNSVFDTTINLIEGLTYPQGMEALDLLKLMVYLPANEIRIEIMEKISRMCLNRDLDEDGLDTLKKHSLISFHEEEEEEAVDSSSSSSSSSLEGRANKGRRIEIQEMLRLYCIRKLDDEYDLSYMLSICRFYAHSHVSMNLKNKQAMISLHRRLKNRNWPEGSIYFSIIFCSYLITDKNYFQHDVSLNWQKLRDSVHYQNRIAAVTIAQDIFSFLDERAYRDIKMKGIINLFLSCLFWLDQKEIPRWDDGGGDGGDADADVKKKNSAVKRKSLESIFVSLVKPTIMGLLAPKKDFMPAVSELCHQFCYNSLRTFELNEESTSLHNKIDEIIFSTVNKAKDCRPSKIGKIYDLLWKFGFHGTGKSFVKCLKTVLKKHFEVYPEIMRRRYDCNNSGDSVEVLLHQYWVDGGPLRFNKFIEHCNDSYEDYTIYDCYDYSYYYEELLEEDEINNKFIETFFKKKGIQVITDYLQFMCRENFSTTHAFLFQFIDIMAFEAHGADNFLRDEAFMKAFYKFTLKFGKNQRRFLGLQIQCATSWFGLFAKRNVQPIGREGAGAGVIQLYQFSIHDVASQLANMLRFIKPITTGYFGHCFRALCKKEVYTSFLETYRDEPQCLAVETAQSLLAMCLD